LPKDQGPFKAKKHRFQDDKKFTDSKSEVGARIPDSERLTLRSSEDDDVPSAMRGNEARNFNYEFQMTSEDHSSPFVHLPKSATLRQSTNSYQKHFLRTQKIVEGTGGGFSQLGCDESGLVSSEAQEFLHLE